MFYRNDAFAAACGAPMPHTILFSFLPSTSSAFFFFKVQFLDCSFTKWVLVLLKFCFSFLCLQMKPGAKTVVSWCIAWLVLAARSPSLWLISCRSSICQWTMLMTLSRWRNPTSPPTSTSWASCWTLRGRLDSAVPVTIGSLRSSSISRPPRTRMSTRWTPCSPRERSHAPWWMGLFLQPFLLAASAGLLSLYVAPGVQLSVLDKVPTCGIGYYNGRDLLYSCWKNRTGRVDPGHRFAPYLRVQPTHAGTGIWGFPGR